RRRRPESGGDVAPCGRVGPAGARTCRGRACAVGSCSMPRGVLRLAGGYARASVRRLAENWVDRVGRPGGDGGRYTGGENVLVVGFPADAFGTNCYVLASGPGEQCLIVDPGIGVVDRLEEVLA